MIGYKIVSEEGLLYCNISGEVKTLDFQEHAKKSMNDDKFHLKLNSIISISENSIVSYANEATGIGKVLTEILHRRDGICWAFVVKNQTTKSIVNLMLLETNTKHISIAFFATEEEAKFWIKER